MGHKNTLLVVGTALAIILSALILSACSGSIKPGPTPSPSGGGSIVNSDSVVTAKIQAIRKQASGYPWELDVLIESSIDVGNLPNPTKDSVGKVITVKTDQDMNSYKVGNVVNAKVKYVGDAPKPGIALYMYNIALEINP